MQKYPGFLLKSKLGFLLTGFGFFGFNFGCSKALNLTCFYGFWVIIIIIIIIIITDIYMAQVRKMQQKRQVNCYSLQLLSWRMFSAAYEIIRMSY